MPINSGGSSTTQLSFSTFRDFYSDSNPVKLGDYYRNGAYVKSPSSDAGTTESNFNSSVETNTSNSINVGSLNQTYKTATPTVTVTSTDGTASGVSGFRNWVGESNSNNWQTGRYFKNFNNTVGTTQLLVGAVWNGVIQLTFQVSQSGYYYFIGEGSGVYSHQHRFQLYGSGLASSDLDIYVTTSNADSSSGDTGLQRVQLTANTDITAKGFMPSNQKYHWHASFVKLHPNDDTNGGGQLMWI